ncbi:MAG: class 1 fructose-bisphosphatase [Solitalea-like symbiont of Acarus siro]
MNKKESLQHFLEENIENDRIKSLINAISSASIATYKQLQLAFLDDNLIGGINRNNIHGETTQKLDMIANDIFVEKVISSKSCNIIVSEELDEAIMLNQNECQVNYLFALDPLDGSSNLEVNAPVGSIFSIYSYDGYVKTAQDALNKGNSQLAAGYVFYSTSVILALAIGKGLYFFTLDIESNNFYLSKKNIIIPEKGSICSVNMGNYNKWTEEVKQNIDYFIADNYSFRYMASMVADMHRIIINGGVFVYPGTINSPGIGKLRLLYECNPLAFIMDKANGAAVNGSINIMEIDINDIHQKTAIFAGSKQEVLRFLD